MRFIKDHYAVILEYKEEKKWDNIFVRRNVSRHSKRWHPLPLVPFDIYSGGAILQMSQCSKRPHLLCWLQTARVLFLWLKWRWSAWWQTRWNRHCSNPGRGKSHPGYTRVRIPSAWEALLPFTVLPVWWGVPCRGLLLPERNWKKRRETRTVNKKDAFLNLFFVVWSATWLSS